MPSLVLLAAGLGTRFGGLKQLAPVGPSGEALMDYAVYDAVRSGFERLVLIVRTEISEQVQEHAARYPLPVDYVLQDLEPTAPKRPKPWGTCHALLACESLLGDPFAVLNADDFYGPSSLALLGSSLGSGGDAHLLVAYPLRTTLSEHGTVSRGVCEVRQGRLVKVVETQVPPDPAGAGLTGDEPASMNCWGFRPAIVPLMRERFEAFLDANREDAGAELQLPTVVNELIAEDGGPRFDVPMAKDQWIGITHAADLDLASARMRDLVGKGSYPPTLFDA